VPNKNSGKATQGSRLYLQQYMLNSKEKLSEMIISASPSLLAFVENEVKIDWKSPLEKTQKGEFYEYRDDFLEVLDLDEANYKKSKEKLKEFWPKNGPQWDGLAVINGSNKQKGFLLVEAKAHIDETKSDLKAKSNESINIIQRSIDITQEFYEIQYNDWTKHYYQLGNRIAYLYFMNEVLNIPTWLVLINFTDGAYKSTSLKEWLIHYNQIYRNMGIHENCKLLNKIIQVFPNPI
jgi:hypothetical protein